MNRSAWFAALLLVTASAAAQTNVTEKLQAGDAALQKFELQVALDAYREARHAAPDNYEAAWKFSRALADKATLSPNRAEQAQLCIDAEKSARDATNLNPNDSKGHTYLAIAVGKRALFEGGKRKVALSKEVKAEADAALKLNPNDDLACHVLGVWNREMSELNWVLKRFAELLYGRFPPASLDDAMANLRRAAELAPNVVPHHVELGITLASARKWPEANQELERALAMPKAWVTDEHYRAMAKETLDRVKSHLD